MWWLFLFSAKNTDSLMELILLYLKGEFYGCISIYVNTVVLDI